MSAANHDALLERTLARVEARAEARAARRAGDGGPYSPPPAPGSGDGSGDGRGEIHLVAAARPNLPKLAALWHALADGHRNRRDLPRPVLVHTGQHDAAAMFHDHLADLGLPPPAVSLGVAGGGHAALTGRTIVACGELWARRRPVLAVVPGDVDGALAAGIAARKLAIPMAHLEAGLRCGDRAMPEEVNRLALDAVADLLWAPDEHSAERLLREGHAPAAVRAVGNAMADSLLRALPAARARPLPEGLEPGGYGAVTLHRPANVDDPVALAAILAALGEAAAILPLVWPMHPRTAARINQNGMALPPNVRALPPLGYAEFLGLLARARLVATDSGGVQEEATVLDLPCLTLRPSTERPVTLLAGSNRLVPAGRLPAAVAAVLRGHWPRAQPIPLWDGRAGERMVAHLREWLAGPLAAAAGGGQEALQEAGQEAVAGG